VYVEETEEPAPVPVGLARSPATYKPSGPVTKLDPLDLNHLSSRPQPPPTPKGG
jgi:hypothetical protein